MASCVACERGSEDDEASPAVWVETRGPRAERLVGTLGLRAPRDDDPGETAEGPLAVLIVSDAPSEASPSLDSSEAAVKDAYEVELAPHDLAEAHALIRDVARLAGRATAGEQRVRALLAPLATRAVRHLGKRRPCVGVLVGIEPLVLAGGHSFETDLLHALGAESTTHGAEAWRVETDFPELAARALDLLLVTAPGAREPFELRLLEMRLAPTPVRAAAIDSDVLWLGEAHEIEALLDRWTAPIEAARERAARAENCALPAPAPAPADTSRTTRAESGPRDPDPNPG